MSFRSNFGLSVSVIIIDCLEIKIETPSCNLAKVQTWSNYKHHNTIKYLIGICPHGAITFISKGLGGRTTDKKMQKIVGFWTSILLLCGIL